MKNILAASSKKLLAINMGIDWQYGNRILEWNNPPFKGNPLGIYIYSLFGCLCMFLSFISLPLHRPPLKALGIGTDAQTMHSYLGWEQEFFVISADHFKARPDLVNSGRRDLRHFAESVEMIFGTFFRNF